MYVKTANEYRLFLQDNCIWKDKGNNKLSNIENGNIATISEDATLIGLSRSKLDYFDLCWISGIGVCEYYGPSTDFVGMSRVNPLKTSGVRKSMFIEVLSSEMYKIERLESVA